MVADELRRKADEFVELDMLRGRIGRLVSIETGGGMLGNRAVAARSAR